MAVLSCLQLKKCHEELNKRIFEHDKLVAEGSDKTDITLKVGSAEETLHEIIAYSTASSLASDQLTTFTVCVTLPTSLSFACTHS